MSTLSSAKVRQIQNKLQALLADFAEDNNFKFETTKCTYSPQGTMKFTFELATISEDGIPADWKKNCARYGYEESDYGRTFTSRGITYRLTGFAPRRRKYPVSAVRVEDGRTYKFTKEAALNSWILESRLEGLSLSELREVAIHGTLPTT